jgi:CAP12/Pycsar effector protein, TIR domain
MSVAGTKPRIFIGSSTEALSIADVAQSVLDPNYGHAEVWNNSIFSSLNVPLETLEKAVLTYDFALFVFLPVDDLNIRGVPTKSIRDNVIFELGLFLGKLGRERVFFIAPSSAKKEDLHLPSDLAGITPATYDQKAKNLNATVSRALNEFKQKIAQFGTSKTGIILDGSEELKPFLFTHRNAYIFKDDKKASGISKGSLEFTEQGTIKISRTNTEGKYELELRPEGKKAPSIKKLLQPPSRIFKVTCEVRVSNGSTHSLRFLLKDLETNQWVSREIRDVTNNDWGRLSVYLRASSTAELLFRIDDFGVSAAPSHVELRQLSLSEEQ